MTATWHARIVLPLDPQVVAILRGTPLVRLVRGTAMPIPATYMHQYANDYLCREQHKNALRVVGEWMVGANRDGQHFLGATAQIDDDNMVTTWTFGNRDTALLFRLSLA